MPSAKAERNWADRPMSPEASDYFQNTFLRKCRELEEKVAKTPLAVLVWGPGPAGGSLYAKRRQIRAKLREMGLAAAFSEEIETGSGGSAKQDELIQAMAADFIVILQSSPGSIAELHDFCGFLEIARKMLVFIDQHAIGGYSYTGALAEMKTLFNNVETFTSPEDIDQCHLLANVIQKVRILRFARWRATLNS